MKQIINSLAAIFPYFRHGSFFVLAFLLLSLSSCFQHFYKTNTTGSVDGRTLDQLESLKKNFIVHTPAGSFGLKNIVVGEDMISGDKEPLNPKNSKYLNPVAGKANRVPKRQMGIALEEVHLYTNNLFEGNERINLSTNQIFRTDVYGFDRDATRRSRVTSIIGITISAAVIIGIGAIAASSVSTMVITIPM